MWSRPHTLALAVTLYAVGYAMCAGAQNITTVVAGQVIYTLGNSGITFRQYSRSVALILLIPLVNSLIIADITSLQWRSVPNTPLYDQEELTRQELSSTEPSTSHTSSMPLSVALSRVVSTATAQTAGDGE
jgi:Na+/melibiose symporter-like transporter